MMPMINATYAEVARGSRYWLHPESQSTKDVPFGLMDLTDDLLVGIHGHDESRSLVSNFIKSLNVSFQKRMSFEHRNVIPRKKYA